MTDLAELSDAFDLEYWVGRESLPYKLGRGASGMQLNMRACPECGREDWRVYLNADTGLGNCFGCGIGFNKLKFVHATLGTGKWRDTFQHVKDCLHDQGWRPRRMVAAAVVDVPEVKIPISFPLPIDGQNLLYLEQRGITAELAAYFHLRYCENGWWNFWDAEREKHSGQNFGNRVIIPVHDIDGKLVTFQGRDLTGTSDRKYLFPMTLPGTGRYLYNGQNCFKTTRAALAEGAFGVYSLKIAFDDDSKLRDVVPLGSFGKHLSSGDVSGNDQLGRFILLKARGLEEVTIMWDGEKAALISALDAARKLTSIGLRAKLALLPTGKDPNDIPGIENRLAFYAAKLWTPQLDILWRLRNPYAVPQAAA